MNTQLRLRLSQQQIAWAICLAFDGMEIADISEFGDVEFTNGETADRRAIREGVFIYLAENGVKSLPPEADAVAPERFTQAAQAAFLKRRPEKGRAGA